MMARAHDPIAVATMGSVQAISIALDVPASLLAVQSVCVSGAAAFVPTRPVGRVQ